MPLRRHLLPIDCPFTPVSPSNLEPLTSRFQQVSLAELAYINEHLSRNDTHHKSGWSTPLTSSAAGQRSGDDYFSAFDEEDDKRAEIRADAERPFPVDREVLKELINTHMHSSVIRMQFLSSGELCWRSSNESDWHQGYLLTWPLGSDRDISQGISCIAERWPRGCSADCPKVHAAFEDRVRSRHN